MRGHMNQEDVDNNATAVLHALRTEHRFSNEQIRRICTNIVRKIGSLKKAKADDATPPDEAAE